MASFLEKQKPSAGKVASYATIITVLIATELVGTFESAMIFIAIPRLMSEFNADAATTGWAATSFLLVAAAAAAICGRLGDVYGRKRMLIIVMAISIVGSIISFSSGTLTGVIIGRAFQGAAGATLPLGLGIARESLQKEKVPGAIALVAAVSFIAGAGGALVAGILLDLGNWRALFLVSGVMAIIATIMAIIMLPKAQNLPEKKSRIDYIGGLLFAPAIALVLYGLTNSVAWGITDARTLQFIFGGLALAAIWVWWELRVDNPMINLRLLTTNKMGLTQLITAILGIGPLAATQIVGPMIMLSPEGSPVGLGLTATQGGLIIFAASAISFALAPLSGKIAAVVGARKALLIGILLTVIGYVLLFWGQHSLGGYLTASVVMFIGSMFIFTAFPNLVAEAVPMENTSEGMGINTVTRTIFMAVGTTVTTMALASSTVPESGVPTQSAYTVAYIVILVTSVLGLFLTMLIKDKKSAATSVQNEELASALEH